MLTKIYVVQNAFEQALELLGKVKVALATYTFSYSKI